MSDQPKLKITKVQHGEDTYFECKLPKDVYLNGVNSATVPAKDAAEAKEKFQELVDAKLVEEPKTEE